jgi:hypothetical protein
MMSIWDENVIGAGKLTLNEKGPGKAGRDSAFKKITG